MRNGRDTRSETCCMAFIKSCTGFWKFLWTEHHCGINDDTDDDRWAQRLGVAETAFWVGVFVLIQWQGMYVCMSCHVYYSTLRAQRLLLEFLKQQVLVNEFCLFRAFCRCQILHDFHTWGVTFKLIETCYHGNVVFAIAIFYASLNVDSNQTFVMLNFYTTYKFLSNFLL